jgi:uncharacterized repeat protein (TIGR04138 family)
MDEIKKLNLLKRALAEARRASARRSPPLGKRYDPEAVNFLKMALVRAGQLYEKLDPDLPEAERHLTGREVLEGVRVLGLELFGPLAPVVFRHWGVHRTEDWGRIVFGLVEAGVLRKTESDSMRDFQKVYDFQTVFGSRAYWRDVAVETIPLGPWEREDETDG